MSTFVSFDLFAKKSIVFRNNRRKNSWITGAFSSKRKAAVVKRLNKLIFISITGTVYAGTSKIHLTEPPCWA